MLSGYMLHIVNPAYLFPHAELIYYLRSQQQEHPDLALLQSIDDMGSLFVSMGPNESSEESYTDCISAQLM